MKKILNFFILAICSITICACKETPQLSSDKVYFFYQTTCPHCHAALEHINMVAPDLDLEIYEISGTGRDLFIQCVRKFNLPNKEIGTPLICMGDKYLIGWSEEEARKFDDFVQPFLTSEVNY